MEKLIAFSLLICLIWVGIYFFHKGKLSSTSFTAFVLGSIFLFIGFYSIDRIKEFNVTGMRLVLSEMKDTKSNFDKRVTMLLEILAELNIDFTSSQGMWIDAPIPDKLLKSRGISEQLLIMAGKSNEEIARQTNIIDKEIIGNYLGSLWRNITTRSAKFKDLDSIDIENIKTQFGKEIHSYNKGQASDIDSLVGFLESKDIEKSLYTDYVDDIRFYIKEHALRRPNIIN